MTLLLDSRQRAMLAEIGVRVWQPVAPSLPDSSEANDSQRLQSKPALEATPSPAVRMPPSRPKTVVSQPVSDEPIAVAASPSAQPLPPGLAQMGWQDLQTAAAQCTACDVCHSRQRSVFSDGMPASDNRATDWLVVGDAPNDAEDASGMPFSGPEGVLLDAMLHAMGLKRQQMGAANETVVLVNAMKCRPAAHHHPSDFELSQCRHYLKRQIELLQPRMILVLGRLAAQSVLHDSVEAVSQIPLGKLRGQFHQAYGHAVMVTYHPSSLLRTPADKAKTWNDLCLAMDRLRGSNH